jgi:hypothetical protein
MAARKSPEQLKQEGRTIEFQLADARKRPMSFALLIGKDGLFLETDPKKDPDVLWRMAKKNGGGPKGASGRMSVSGKTISLVCDNDDVPTQLPKVARRFLSERGLIYDISVVTPGGPLTEGDDAPQGEPAQGAAPDDAALRASLVQELDAMGDRLAQAGRSRNKGAAQKVALLADMVRSQIDADLKKARAALALLSRKVDEAIGFGLQESAAGGKRIGRLSSLEARIDGLLAQVA